MPKLDNQIILLAFVVVTGLAVLLQAIILLAIFFAVRKAVACFREETENLRTSIMPVIYDTRDMLASTQGTMTNMQAFLADAQAFLTRISPQVESVAGDLVEITNTLRTQTAEMQSSAMEMMERVHRQSDRVDGMITEFLNTVDRAGGFVAEAVSRPVRQISGILRSAKAVVESLRAHRTMRQPAQPLTGDNRRF
jgi:methyl-accepting chemotaxis protein